MGENMPPLTHPQPAVGPAKVRRSGATRCGEMREVSWDEVIACISRAHTCGNARVYELLLVVWGTPQHAESH